MGIGRNTAVTLAADVVVFALGILLSVVLTRGLGPDQRGVYVLLVTTNSLLTNVANLGVGSACTTFLARKRYSLGQINSAAIILALLAGLCCVALISAAFPLLQGNVFNGVSYSYLLIALLLIPATLYQAYWNTMMIGLNRIVLLNKVNLILSVGNVLLMVALIVVLRLGLVGFMIGWATTTLVGVCGSLILAVRLERPAWPLSRAMFGDMLGFGLRSHGAGIAHQLFLRFDTFTVNAMLNTRAVGFYSFSTSLAEKLWLPSNAVNSSSVSKITELPRHESALLTAKIIRASVLIMLTLGLPFAAVSPWLLPLMGGPEFIESVTPLALLLPGTLCFALMLVLSNYIVGQMQRPGLLSIINWAQLAFSVPLYLGLIAWLGIVGAAIASTLTYALALVCVLVVFMRDSGLGVIQTLAPRPSDLQDYIQVLKTLRSRASKNR